jgi:uncharacterized protein involved in cysteine biosynthesis
MLITLLLAPLALAATNSTVSFTKITQTIEQILNSVDNFLQHLKDVLKTHISSMSKTLSVILGLVGAFLYFSSLNKYTGRGMIIGAVLLYLLAEFVLNL